MTNGITDDDYFDMLGQVDSIGANLTDWEIDFTEDVLSVRPEMTDKRKEVIHNLFDTYVVNRGAKPKEIQ